MRFGISNLMMGMLVVAIVTAWQIDRSNQRQELQTAEATIQLFCKSHMMSEAHFPKCADTDRIKRITEWHDERAHVVFRLMAIFERRSELDDAIELNTVANIYMKMLGCDTVEDLQRYLQDSEFDLNIVLNSRHQRHHEFSEFIRVAMSDPYSWFSSHDGG